MHVLCRTARDKGSHIEIGSRQQEVVKVGLRLHGFRRINDCVLLLKLRCVPMMYSDSVLADRLGYSYSVLKLLSFSASAIVSLVVALSPSDLP
jgi:hypothetical protein